MRRISNGGDYGFPPWATDRTAPGLIRFPVGLSELSNRRCDPLHGFERLQRNAWCSALVVAVSWSPQIPGQRGFSRFSASAVPPRPWWHGGIPVVGGSDCQHLVQLYGVAFEGQPGCGHVQPPDPRRAESDLADTGAPVLTKVRVPFAQG